jgi:hypothetical protein
VDGLQVREVTAPADRLGRQVGIGQHGQAALGDGQRRGIAQAEAVAQNRGAR